MSVTTEFGAKIRTSQDLTIYSNSEYVYAISPIDLALFWGKGGKEIANSEPLSTVFTILTHCLNKTAVKNYSAMTYGQWFRLDTQIKGLSH